mmetsp:Transcript_2446/g.3124  ORF Transcript_2446/g.3124 Transcript_2446/m.3124 type:complete len:96 (+) Transcript_2446:261-548(+)
MEAAQQLPDHLKGEFFQILEEMQVRDSVALYNRLLDRCFGECVNSFHSKKLESGESQCMNTCTQKFMKMSQRAGQRFQEHQMKQQQQGIQQFAEQ